MVAFPETKLLREKQAWKNEKQLLIFPLLLYIPWNTDILSVLSFDNCMYLCNTDSYPNIEYDHHLRTFPHFSFQSIPRHFQKQPFFYFIFSYYRLFSLVLEIHINGIIWFYLLWRIWVVFEMVSSIFLLNIHTKIPYSHGQLKMTSKTPSWPKW